MTSEAQECFVYLQLPKTTDVVTCGRLRLERGTGKFIYGRSYLDDPRAVELDARELRLVRGHVYTTARHGGVFSALRDAAPDAWGRRVIERQFRRPLSELEFLLLSPEDRAGALSFGRSASPPSPVHRFNAVVQLERLLEEAALVEADKPPSPQIAELIQPGTSLGGARPKNVVEDKAGLLVAKFPSRTDRWNCGAVEAGMLCLARMCGLRVAYGRTVKVLGKDVLLVERFDRVRVEGGYQRHRMVSALTVLGADETPDTRWSYLLLADELARWVEHPKADLVELFTRMVFNAMTSNGDDHPRNHAFIAPGRSWQLSPAYDLTPSPQPALDERYLAMTVGRMGRLASRANLLSECGRFRLSRDAANAIVDSVKKTVTTRWREALKKCGASDADCAAVESSFRYPGFEYTPKVT